MTNQHDPWGNQQRPLGQPFNRQHPPVLPPPATLETGGQSFYPLPSLPSLGNGAGHPQPGHGFNIPSINAGEPIQMNTAPEAPSQDMRRSSTGTQLPPPVALGTEHQVLQPTAPPGVPNRSTTTNIYRPLNVKDALSYLDQVKVQFYNQSDVYNNFLDIMKDFKSQSIDTPGVIDRVSTLFRGYPNLIQGFNTFLPPGYRIECSLDPSDPNPIRVTTPTGTTTRPNIDGDYNQVWNSGATAEHRNTLQESQQQQQFSPDQAATQAAHAVQLAHSQSLPQGVDQQQQPNGGQIEFNHAISYVNKIKTRFANQPDIYKQFLEILQTYQREQKPIGEVYEQVTVLFSNSPDLLDDFKQFLPDTSNQAFIQQQQQIPQGPYYGTGNGVSQLPPVGNFHPSTGSAGFSPSNAQQHFSHQANYQITGVPGNPDAAAIVNNDVGASKKKHSISEGYSYDESYNQEAQVSNLRTNVQPFKKDGSKNGITAVTNPTLVAGIPEPVPPFAAVKTSSLLEELSFFDRVKKAIGNKQTYNEFLKILNLFSQDIIDKVTLVKRVEGFIGDIHPELLTWFKMFVGYQEPTQHIEDITFKKHQLELSLCKAYGPSYRQLPKAETYMPCSGRDEMCWEVLNDEWVGHPTWASEDSGFIAHRKNQYEEILFKIEEERLEFDYNMEANLRTIQTLETIANRIANMTPEQKASFKLPPGLGHTSQTIYKKVIRKIYDKDRGFEVIDALHDNPAIAVPIVLKRLKQKDEEWKRSQREWNKVWREMEQKVFYKSLDHLGLTFKQADKKLLTAKQLVSEISTVKIEQQNKRLHPLTPRPQEQLNYEFNDVDIIMDIVKLSDVFINRSSNYSVNDREKLTQFFKFFISLFFGIPTEDIESALAARSKENSLSEAPKDVSELGDSSSSPTTSASSAIPLSPKKRHRESDLLKDVLKKQSKSRKDEHSESPAANDDSDEQDTSEGVENTDDLWIKTSALNTPRNSEKASPEKRDRYNLICNTTIYVFFRHFRTLYERFDEIKKMSASVGEEIRSRKTPSFAKDLNLLSHQIEDMGIEIVGDKDCYSQMLNLSAKVIEGEVDHQWFEETLRQGFRNKAYKIYTVDKVIQALVKHMHTMVTDSRTSEMMVLYESERTKPVSSAKDQIIYRIKVRSLMSSDENMFKIAFKESDRSVNIQFVGLDDLIINDHENAEEKYNYYITSYIMSHPTEGVPASKILMPFSKSFIENVDDEQCDGHVTSGLKVSICQNSYRLFFEADTYDSFTANNVFQKGAADEVNTKERIETLRNFVNDDELGWKLTIKDQNAEVLQGRVDELFKKGASSFHELIKRGEMNEETNTDNVVSDGAVSGDKHILLVDENMKTGSQEKQTAESEHNYTQDANDTTADDNTTNQEEVTYLPESEAEGKD